MSTVQSFYSEKVSTYTAQIKKLQQRINGVATLRLVLFASLAIAVFFIFGQYSHLLLSLVLLLLVVFIVLVNVSLRLKDRRALLEKLLYVNTNEAALLNGQFNEFDNGQAFLRSEGYLDDLDIFGNRSLYHLLNRTTTSHGKERLSSLLGKSLPSASSITASQDAIRQLSGQSDKRQLLTAYGLLNHEDKGNLYSLTDWLQTPSRLLHKKWLIVLRWILIIYNMGAILFYLDTNNFAPLTIGILVSWGITGSYTGYISSQHLQISKKQNILDQYATILRIFNSIEPGNSALLNDLQAQTGKAHQSIRQLARLSSFFDQRLNILVNILLNSILLYDLQCMISLERWKEGNRKGFPGWIDAVGNIESLNSLATFAFNNPEYIYPTAITSGHIPTSNSLLIAGGASINTQQPGSYAPLVLETTRMAHPLIPSIERVPNDFTMGQQEKLILLTGSNMSGKTTFLRTIGVNLVLAQCGAPVCAASFSFTPMQLLTSLRVSDSLQEHTSYFMAELKKLQKIVLHLQSGQPSLVLIDEILRGTNSEDKTYGSEKFILRLLRYHCLSLFATHDLSLGSMAAENPGQISNYCFESVIEHGALHFNYTLQKGLARNRNASFLMEKMDII